MNEALVEPVAQVQPGTAAGAWPAWFQAALARHGRSTYPQYLLHRSAVLAQRPALIHRETTWSYAGLSNAVLATAQHLLAAYALSPGSRVVLNGHNSDTYPIVYLAVMAAGWVAVPANPKLTVGELAYIAHDAGAGLYLHDRTPDDHDVQALAEMLSPMVALSSFGELLRREPTASDLAPVDADAPAVIFYTSGTTGQPKGVMHSHRTLVAGALQAAHAWGYAQDGLVNLAITPLFHVAAHSWAYPTWAHAGTLVVDSYGTERLFDLVERHAIDGFGCVPSMLMMLLRSERGGRAVTTSVRNVRFGASPMPPDRLREVQALFPNAKLYHGMGQTESCGTLTVLPAELAHAKAGSTGRPLPGCELRIVDDADRDLPRGQTGEVLARSPSVMLGYFGRPDASAETLRGGWLHTGDLGYVDDEGLMYLVDRKKDMIIRGGENIYSVEIENVLLAHPRVLACAVVGLPDEVMGERVCAVIAGLPPEDAPQLVDLLKAWCRAQLAAFKVPEHVLFLPELPQTATGKTQKAQLRQLVLQRMSPDA